MRKWNRLSLTLPLGLVVAALNFPLRLALAANSAPTAIQAALRVGPGETTPHFFTGDTQLSSFQRLPEPIQHPLQSTAVTAVPVPNVEQRPIEQPRPGLTPTVVSSVATVQVPPQPVQLQQPQQQPPLSGEPLPQPPLGKPIAWEGEPRIDAHFFPKHSPLRFASYLEPVVPPTQPARADHTEPQPPRLRSAEIQPIGAAQVAIAPPPSPPQQQQMTVPAPEPVPQAIGNPIAWDAEQPIDVHFFPNHRPASFLAYLEAASPTRQAALASDEMSQATRLRGAEIRPVGAAQVAIAPPQAPPQFLQPPPPQLPPQRSTPTPNASFASMPVGPTADRAATLAPPVNTVVAARLPSDPPTIGPTISLAPEFVEPTPPQPERTASPAKTAASETKRLRDAHFTLGPMRLASLERQPTNLQAPPLKETVVQPAAPPALPPLDPLVPAPPIPSPQVVTLPVPIKPQLTSLEMRSASSLSPTALAALPPPALSLTPNEPQLTSLRTYSPEPVAPLVPTEVLAAASPPPLQEQFRLTALQPLSAPGVNLQPTEVLPIPTPYSPTAPRVPTAIDAERPIGAVTSNIANTSGRMPTDLAVDRFRGDYPAYLPRDWEDSMYFWDAPSMCIGPLRYEEVNLERFGYSHCPAIQPVLSGMHFLGATLALPYSIAARPFGTCQYPLGHYRPGSPVPFRHIRPEFQPWPATVECMTIAGLILLIP